MDFRSIESFIKVSELRSFSKAAEHLGYTQSAISTQIIKLEQELGYALFDRIGHNITLSEQGQEFFKYATQVTLLTEELHQKFNPAAGVSGHLRIAMADSLLSAFTDQILLHYQQMHPAVKITVRTGTTDDIFHWLAHNEVDFIYTLDHRISRSDLTVLMESEVPVYFYSAASHPLAALPSVPIDSLKDYPLYMTEQGVSYRKLLDISLGSIGQELIPNIELGNVSVIRKLTEQSRGISFLPEFVMEQSVKQKQTVTLNVDSLQISVWRQLVYHRGKSVTPAMRTFIELLGDFKG